MSMVPGVVLAGLSARAAFVLSAILLVASSLLTTISIATYPNLWPNAGFAGLTVLLTLTTAYTAGVWRRSADSAEAPRR